MDPATMTKTRQGCRWAMRLASMSAREGHGAREQMSSVACGPNVGALVLAFGLDGGVREAVNDRCFRRRRLLVRRAV